MYRLLDDSRSCGGADKGGQKGDVPLPTCYSVLYTYSVSNVVSTNCTSREILYSIYFETEQVLGGEWRKL